MHRPVNKLAGGHDSKDDHRTFSKSRAPSYAYTVHNAIHKLLIEKVAQPVRHLILLCSNEVTFRELINIH